MTILDAIHDPLLFKPLFKTLDSWTSWLCVLRATFALEMSEADLTRFTKLSGRETPPSTRSKRVGWWSDVRWIGWILWRRSRVVAKW